MVQFFTLERFQRHIRTLSNISNGVFFVKILNSLQYIGRYRVVKRPLGYSHSRPEAFCKKDVFKNFTKFTGKHLCRSLFFNSVAGLRPASLFKKKLTKVLSYKFCEIFKYTFSIEYLWQLFRSVGGFRF